MVGDSRWSYDGLLPYFCKSETSYDEGADPEQHGFNGPMATSTARSTGRDYPLRDTAFKTWTEIGLEKNVDANDGSPQGIAELVDNRKDGLRQLTTDVYPIKGVTLMTETLVKRVILGEDLQATGVELADGRIFKIAVGGEVIVSAGSYRTPTVLMLSGIGQPGDLEKHGIESKVDLPVGNSS